MILEGIFNMLFGLCGGLLNFLPGMEMVITEDFTNVFCEIMSLIAYFVPLQTVGAILSIIISIQVFKIIISFIKTLWQLIPIL